MESLLAPFQFALHFDEHLSDIIARYQTWTYAILFLIIFAETGLVVTPILPGDSLLFVAGAFAAAGQLSPIVLLVVLTIAAILGDSVNYAIGSYIGPKVFTQKQSRIFKKEYLDRTTAFYEKHGPKTIVLARFVPIVRTFAPFVAGVGKMHYGKFVTYNILGGILWVGVCVLSGYFFGNIPIVKENFEVVVLIIIFLSCIPAVLHMLPQKKKAAALVILSASVLMASSASADKVVLNSGKIVEGKITGRVEDQLTIKTEDGIELTFYSDEIASFEDASEPAPVAQNAAQFQIEEPLVEETVPLAEVEVLPEPIENQQEIPSEIPQEELPSSAVTEAPPVLLPPMMMGPGNAQVMMDNMLKHADHLQQLNNERSRQVEENIRLMEEGY